MTRRTENQSPTRPASSSNGDPLGPILEPFLARFRKKRTRQSLTEYIVRYLGWPTKSASCSPQWPRLSNSARSAAGRLVGR